MSAARVSVGEMGTTQAPREASPTTDHTSTPVWDAAQRAIIERDAASSGVVVGAPGTGKTSVLVARAAALVRAGENPDGIVVLTPTRQTATALRDRLTLALPRATSGAPARSLASFVFEIVRAHAVHRGDAVPQLLTGADEDAIIHELLRGDEDDESAGAASRWPAGFGPDVRASPAFRGELRAFIAECTALGVTPGELVGLAAQEQLPVWRALAAFIEEYIDVRGRLRAAHRDAAGLIAEAVRLVRGLAPDAAGFAPVRRLGAVLLDDAQELTVGGVAFIEALHERGVAITAFGDPDLGSGVFRGARPEHFARLAASLGETAVLSTVHRGTPAQEDAVRRVTTRIGAAGTVVHRRAPAGVEDDGSVRVRIARSALEEHDAIARLLRERHLHDGVPWSACAVIAHDSRQVAVLEAELAAREVPARGAGLTEPLGRRACVRDLLRVVHTAIMQQSDPSAADAETLLAAGFDPIDVRRLRNALRQSVLRRAQDTALRQAQDTAPTGGDPTAAAPVPAPRELLSEALRHPAELILLGTREAVRAARIAETLGLLRSALDAGAGAHELLWIAWSRSGLEERWVEASRGSGPLAEQAGRDLDAIVALFQAAKRFGERAADGGVTDPKVFIRGVLDSDVAEDLFAPVLRPGTVQVLTPSAALGVQFDTVVIAGMQDGVWPNTRLRGELLRGWRLADARARAAFDDDAVSAVPLPSALDRRREVMHDELRLLARALSRASALVVVTAVDDDDHTPSAFLELLPDPEKVAPRHPLSLRGLVAAHRRTLTAGAASLPEQQHAAEQLALLADARVPGAAPEAWYGVEPATSSTPLHEPLRAPVRLSPSRLETLETCELDWLIGELGGADDTSAAGVGTLLHEAMEAAADRSAAPSAEELWAVVESRWGELEFDAPWRERVERARAQELARRLHVYLRDFAASGGELRAAECRFEVELPFPGVTDAQPIVLAGTVDRVERLASGEVVIVDLKTGATAPRTDETVVDHAQLAAYQVAASSGAIPGAEGLPLGGAKLLVLQAGARDYATPTQPPLDDASRAAFMARVEAAAAVVSGTVFRAPVETHCRDDRGHGLCRIHTVPPVSAS